MAKYRKKPVIVEAEQYLAASGLLPQGVVVDRLRNHPDGEHYDGPAYLGTLGGKLFIDDGDWIITWPEGECWSCKPEIFEETYELVEE